MKQFFPSFRVMLSSFYHGYGFCALTTVNSFFKDFAELDVIKLNHERNE